MFRNFFRKNWKRRFQEFKKLFLYQDPDWWPPEGSRLAYYWRMFWYAWEACMVNGFTCYHETKYDYMVILDDSVFVCDLYANVEAK